MKNNLKRKIIFTLTLAISIVMAISIQSMAAGVSVSPNSVEMNVGETKNITVTVSDAAATVNVSSSDSNVATVTTSSEDNVFDGLFGKTDSKTYAITAKAKGTATINIVTTDYESSDGDTKIPGTKTVNVTVNEKPAEEDKKDDKKEEDKKEETTTTKKDEEKKEETKKELTFSNASGTVYVKNESVNLRSGYTTKENNVMNSLKKGDELTLLGKSTSQSDGYTWYKVKYNGKVGYIATSLVTTTKPKEDKEPPVLKGLVIDEGATTPAFSKNTKTYNLSVENDIEQVTISATPESGATATITCNGETCSGGVVPINEGLNTVSITVSKDGETNTYKIYVRKAIKEDEEGNITDEENTDTDLGLETLNIAGFELSPEFAKDVYSYTVVIPEDDDRTTLDIEAIANTENAKIEIIDNENLEIGENIITIMVTDEENTTRIYQIVVNKLGSNETVAGGNVIEKTKNIVANNLIPVLIICALIIVAIIVLIVIIKSGKKEDDFEEQLEEEENKKDILDTEIPEEAYAENQYLNELREKEENTKKESSEEQVVAATKPKKGKHF